VSSKCRALVVLLLIAGCLAAAGGKLMLSEAETGPMTIGLVQGYRFDPLAGVPELPSALVASHVSREHDYYLVQFAGAIRPEWKRNAERLGAELLWYVPRYAYVARIPVARVEAIRELPEVRWIGLDQPAYKLFPGLDRVDGYQTLIVVFHAAEDGLALIEELKALGCRNVVPEFNAWNKSVKLEVDGSQIPAIARLPGVYWIEPYGEITPDNVDAQWVDQKGYDGTSDTSRPIWRRNITGRNMLVGLTDQQLAMTHDLFRDTLNNTPGPNHRKVVRYFGTQGSSSHGTHTSGTLCGNDEPAGGSSLYDGVAKDARLVYQYYSSFPSGWDMNVWFARPDSGLDITVDSLRAWNHSMSLSRKDTYNTYVFTDMTADQFVWNHRRFLHCNSMGNLTTNQMGHPVNAKSIISTGGTQNGTLCRNIYSSTSRGPTLDGRRKPQLVSPAENVISANSSNPSGYISMSGTSMATPNMTASTALIRQYFRKGFYPTGDTLTGTPREISAALNKAVAIVGADNDVTGYTVPDNNIGWGRIDLDSSLYFAGDESKLWVTDDTTGLQTGDSAMFLIDVADAGRPFRVALCWTDYPGTMRAAWILVNDLDLTTISPSGTEYKGSVYASGQSTPGGIYDTLNVEECTRINEPEIGTWKVKVKGRLVPQGPQPFALAAIGKFGAGGPVHDVGVREILAPRGVVDSGTVVVPRAVVVNSGTADETFYVRFVIGVGYADSSEVTLATGAVDTLGFADWYASPLGYVATECATLLSGDVNPANDVVQDSVRVDPLSGISRESELPVRLTLDAVRPNPFRTAAVLRYGLPGMSRVELRVYSAAGELVRTLVSGIQPAGYRNVRWDGCDEHSRSVGRGVYYARLVAGTTSLPTKLVKLD